jgi:dethiobiotin synthetase
VTAAFVAGAGTDVGKTYVTAALVTALRRRGVAARALKPVASGFDPADWTGSDPGRLLAAMGEPLTQEALEAIAPWRFRAPLGPDLAAAREGRELDLAGLVAFCRRAIAAEPAAPLFIEGVGGAMSPLTPAATNLDWMLALGAPVLLVGGSYLGAISHVLTAAAAIRGAGLTLPAVVVSETEAAETPFTEIVESVARLAAAPVFAAPRYAAPEDWAAPVLAVLNLSP